MNALRIIEWVLLAALLAFSLSGCGRVKEEPALLPSDNFGGETPEADFSVFTNVDISGVDLESLNEEQLSVLVTQARYCQAMTEANLDTLREIVSEDMTFTHMSGLKQTREEKRAIITYTSVLNANAYGADGTYRMYGKHCYELREGAWVAVNR